MIERILKHMNIYREMKNAAIPLNLIGKKGEDSCMNAARLVNQQELSGLMEGLNEETISSLMDDPEILSYLGKMNKKDFPILEPDRIRMVIECAGNEKLSEFPYEKIEKVLADKEIPDRIVYVYLKYYAFLEPKEELKKQLVASLDTCIGEFDVARAGIKIRMLLINPVFSTELLYELLKDEESLALLLKQDLMELVNYLSEFCKETESLNKKQLEELSRHPKEIRNGLEVILTQIPKDWQASFLHLWLWNESLYADIPKLIRFLTGPDADFEKVSNGKAAYVNTLYGNPLPDMDLYELTLEKTELILYAITKRKKHFLELLRKNGDWLINLDRNSLILDEEVYKRCLNLNTLNEQNLRDCEYMVVPWRKSEESLFSKPRVFEELKVLYNVKAVYIDLYDRLAYSKSDDRLRVIRELIKRDCLTDALEENQVERLAEALSKKPLSRWMQEDFKNILDLRHETAIWILIFFSLETSLPTYFRAVSRLTVSAGAVSVTGLLSTGSVFSSLEEAAVSCFAGLDFAAVSALDSALDSAGFSDAASLTAEAASETASETASLSGTASDEAASNATTETDSDSTAEEAVVSAFAPHPDARSIAPQSTTPIIL